MAMFDVTELIKRIVKYLIEGLMVAIAAFAIPKKSLNMEEIVLLALTAAATFAILDTYIRHAQVLASVLALTWLASLVVYKFHLS